MKLVTFTQKQGGVAHLGLLREDAVFDLTAAQPDDPDLSSMLALVKAGPKALAAIERASEAATGASVSPLFRSLTEIDLLAPIPRPEKNVYCVGLNYRSHVEQNAKALGQTPELPTVPLFFSKPVTAVIGPGQAIWADRRLTTKLDYEVELALVIGKPGTWIAPDRAAEHIFGFTLLNDVSARDLQWRTSQFLYGKGLDTYCPIGPAVVTSDELGPLDDVVLELFVNGELRQQESAGNMLFSPEVAVAELSKGITLDAGDIISLGTPGGCGYQMQPPRFLNAGDEVTCTAAGIGELRNPVVAPPL